MVIGDTFIFIHVPKTGGTSVSAALGGRSDRYSLHRPLIPAEKGDRKAFGFVRDPWSWRVSLYNYLQATRPHLIAGARFKTWLMKGAFFLQDDLMTAELPSMQRRSQMYWLGGCDFIGRFERLEEDAEAIMAAIGIRPVSPVGRLNIGRRVSMQDYYDAESAAFVAEHSAAEIERFGYSFPNLAQQEERRPHEADVAGSNPAVGTIPRRRRL